MQFSIYIISFMKEIQWNFKWELTNCSHSYLFYLNVGSMELNVIKISLNQGKSSEFYIVTIWLQYNFKKIIIKLKLKLKWYSELIYNILGKIEIIFELFK